MAAAGWFDGLHLETLLIKSYLLPVAISGSELKIYCNKRVVEGIRNKGKWRRAGALVYDTRFCKLHFADKLTR